MAIESLHALEKASENKDIFEVVLDSDCTDRGVSREASLEKMHALYAAIRRAREGYDPALHSASGMVGGDGAKMREYIQKGKTICGDYIGQVIAQALEMGESNACMKWHRRRADGGKLRRSARRPAALSGKGRA